MSVCLEVILILRSPLDIHVPREPIAILDAGLRPPVRPDAELCVAEPIGDGVGVKLRARRLKWSCSNGERGSLAKSTPGLRPGCCIAEQFNCVAPGKLHLRLPPIPADPLSFASRTKQPVLRPMVISMPGTIINPGRWHAEIQI